MKNNLVPILVLVLLTVAYTALVLGAAPEFPARVAIHFGPGGKADGWADRNAAVVFFEALAIVPAFFLLLASLAQIMPSGAINLPHRDYWLAPERRALTLAAISRQIIWAGCLMVIFLSGIYGLTIEANHLNPPRLPMEHFLPLLAGFLIATAISTGTFVRRFFKAPPGPGH